MDKKDEREVLDALSRIENPENQKRIIILNNILVTLTAAQLDYLTKLSTLLFC